MNAKELGRQPANPCFGVRQTAAGDFTHEPLIYDGLTKREAFAMALMASFRARSNTGVLPPDACAEVACQDADALLAELAKEVA